MQQYYTLSDVVKILGLKPHVITYAITSGHLPEPPVRVGNKRIFTEEDVERMALHFHVRPDWKNRHVGDATELQQVVDVKGLGLKVPFSVESIGPTDHEVRDGDGDVFCRVPSRAKGLVIAGLLESACG